MLHTIYFNFIALYITKVKPHVNTAHEATENYPDIQS